MTNEIQPLLGHEFFRMRNLVNSLSASTAIYVTTGNVTTELSGLCSPYVSHQSIRFVGDPQSPDAIKFSHLRVGNWRGWIAVHKSLDEEVPCNVLEGWYFATTLIPTEMIRPVLKRVAAYVPRAYSIRDEAVLISFPCRIRVGWNDDKSPKFYESPTMRMDATWEPGNYRGREDELLVPPLSEWCGGGAE